MIPGFLVQAEDGSIGRFQIVVDSIELEGEEHRFSKLIPLGVAGSVSAVRTVMELVARLYPKMEGANYDEPLAVQRSRAAVTYLLKQIQLDPDLGQLLTEKSEAYFLLTGAAAELLEMPVEKVRQLYAPAKGAQL